MSADGDLVSLIRKKKHEVILIMSDWLSLQYFAFDLYYGDLFSTQTNSEV